VTLIVILMLECYFGFVKVGLADGDPLLGFGFLFDACARIAGMIAMAASGDADAAWMSVLLGSPALWALSDEDAAGSDSTQVARVIAIVAGITVAFGLLVAVL
jgi:hypothetical protein